MKTQPRRGTRRRRRSGAAALEFALVLPVLLTIVLAAVDLGRFGYQYISVTNAARSGAGLGAMRKTSTSTMGTWRAQIRTAVTEELQDQAGFDPERLTIPDPLLITESGTGLKRVHVEVQYRFSPLVTWPGIPNPVNLARVVEMRQIR